MENLGNISGLFEQVLLWLEYANCSKVCIINNCYIVCSAQKGNTDEYFFLRKLKQRTLQGTSEYIIDGIKTELSESPHSEPGTTGLLLERVSRLWQPLDTEFFSKD
jgi:hypothetical protein